MTLVVVDSRGEHSKGTTHKVLVAVPLKPAISKLHVRTCTRTSRHCRKLGLYASFRLSVRDRVVITITRPHHRRVLKRVVVNTRSGITTHLIRSHTSAQGAMCCMRARSAAVPRP